MNKLKGLLLASVFVLPTMAQAHWMLGTFVQNSGDVAAAQPHFADAVRHADPMFLPMCLETLLESLARAEDVDRAIDVLDRLCAERPEIVDTVAAGVGRRFGESEAARIEAAIRAE